MICLEKNCPRRGRNIGTLGGIKLSYCLRHEYIFIDLKERKLKAHKSMIKIRREKGIYGCH